MIRWPSRFLFLVVLTLAISLTALPRPTEDAPYQSIGTKKMAALLEQIYREQDWRHDPNKAAERASHLREDLASNPGVRDEFRIREVLAENLLKSGASAWRCRATRDDPDSGPEIWSRACIRVR